MSAGARAERLNLSAHSLMYVTVCASPAYIAEKS